MITSVYHHMQTDSADKNSVCNHEWIIEITYDPCNYVERHCKHCFINKKDLRR